METPSPVVSNRADLLPVSDNLNTYNTPMHFNTQSTIKLDGDRATGITYFMAHHLTLEDGKQKLMVVAIRDKDKFVNQEEKWLFAERKLLMDWIENR